ncbi:hypothetical protein JTE90_001414 [Oedothorax gibbosus]|uniref:Uncharacterized protein n=1 Tax=Oedothorax gibbosus TaxID=931172 RepID=A0AAV6VFA2_9ARAC|nr:hypothetical protein JTE90_001414 [Oedothorax gibbosus]
MKLLVMGMTTNVQILTEDGTVTAVVEPENRISAAYQNMRSIPMTLMENYGDWIQVLDLSHNKLRDVGPLKYVPNLHTLILDHNLISSTTLFPRLPSLQVLWLHFNLVYDAALFVPPLARSCPVLRHLSLMGNMAAPITHKGAASAKEEESYSPACATFGQILPCLEAPESYGGTWQPLSPTKGLRRPRRRNLTALSTLRSMNLLSKDCLKLKDGN